MCSCVGSKVCATSISLMGSVMDIFPLHNGVFIMNTLDSGIDVGPTFMNFGFFSRPYGLIREYIKVI